MRRARPWVTGWVACWCLALLLAAGHNAFETPDQHMAEAFVRNGSFALETAPQGSYRQGIDGRYYGIHEIGADVMAVPTAFVAARISSARSLPFERVFGILTGLVGAAYFATTIVLLAAAGRRFGLSFDRTVSGLAALCLSSQYLVYLGSAPDVSLAAPLLAAGFLSWMRAEEGAPGGWVLCGLFAGALVSAKLTMGTFAMAAAALAITARPFSGRVASTRIAYLVLGMIPGLLVVGWWNDLRTGSWFVAPYTPDTLGFDWRLIPRGLAGSLLSPGKGVLVFTPLLLLLSVTLVRQGVARRWPRAAWLLFGSCALAMLEISGTAPWSGAGGWGIRYYVPWIPAFLLLILAEHQRRQARQPWRAAIGLCVVAGLVLNVAGLITNPQYRQQLCGYVPWSWHSANVCAVAALPANLARIVGADIPDVTAGGASEAMIWTSNRIMLWWYGIQTAGVPPVVSWCIPAALALAVLLIWRAQGTQES